MRLPYVSFLRRASFGRPGRPPNVHARSSAGFPETKESLAYRTKQQRGAIAQLGERWLCKPEVAGSIPAGSIDVKGSPRGGADCDCRGKCAGPRPSPRGDELINILREGARGNLDNEHVVGFWFLSMMQEHEEFEVETDEPGEWRVPFCSETVKQVRVD